MYNLNSIYIANIQKGYVKDENNNAKNSTTLYSYVRNVLIENDKIMVSFDITSSYRDIPVADTFKIIMNYFFFLSGTSFLIYLT